LPPPVRGRAAKAWISPPISVEWTVTDAVPSVLNIVNVILANVDVDITNVNVVPTLESVANVRVGNLVTNSSLVAEVRAIADLGAIDIWPIGRKLCRAIHVGPVGWKCRGTVFRSVDVWPCGRQRGWPIAAW
jgi:hypothetical protein